MTHKAIDERHDNYIKYYDINNPIISIEKSIKMVLKIVIFEHYKMEIHLKIGQEIKMEFKSQVL